MPKISQELLEDALDEMSDKITAATNEKRELDEYTQDMLVMLRELREADDAEEDMNNLLKRIKGEWYVESEGDE